MVKLTNFKFRKTAYYDDYLHNISDKLNISAFTEHGTGAAGSGSRISADYNKKVAEINNTDQIIYTIEDIHENT